MSGLGQLVKDYIEKKICYSQEQQKLIEQNKSMTPSTKSSTHSAMTYQQLKNMKAFDEGKLGKALRSCNAFEWPNTVQSHPLTLISLPYGYNLIHFISNLYSNKNHHFFLVLEASSHTRLPFFNMLAQLKRLSIISHRELLAKLSNSPPVQQKILILSCPEIHPKTLATGHTISIRDIDYCFSLFDCLIVRKSKLPLYVLDAQQHKLKLLRHDEANDQLLADFIFSKLANVMEYQPDTIYSWQHLSQCTVKHETCRYLTRLNRLECIIRLRGLQQMNLTMDIQNIIGQIKTAKADIRG